jgi:hypothetical protein
MTNTEPKSNSARRSHYINGAAEKSNDLNPPEPIASFNAYPFGPPTQRQPRMVL